MEQWNKKLQELLKIQSDLQNGTFKRIPNEQRLANFNRDLNSFRIYTNPKNNYSLIQNTCTTESKAGSKHKNFNSNMKPIKISEMTMGTTYKNRYIKFEIVTDIVIMTSIMFLGKDDNNDLVLIAVYNFENHYGTTDIEKLAYIFQKGKFILILEPFYKMFGSGEDGIRIEDPNEIIIFDDKKWIDKFLNSSNQNEFNLINEEKDVDNLMKEANKMLCIQNYNTALAHFEILKNLKPNDYSIDLKMAECYFGLPYYSKCLKKCNEILEIDNYTEILLMKIKCLINLKKISEANEVLQKNINLLQEKNINEFNSLNSNIKNKLENNKGIFNFSEIYKNSKDNFNIDIGEYINSKLEIKFNKSNNKGLSIYTKEKISKGELLIVSKAIYAFDPQKETKNKNEINMQYDSTTDEEFLKTGSLLAYKDKDKIQDFLSYKLSNYIEDYKNFFALYDGNNYNKNINERIKLQNNDLKKIQNVIKYNALLLGFVDNSTSRGIWYYPSFFNHSCIPNCFHFGFGDIIIIISINDIDSNCELCLNYFSNDMLYHTRQHLLKEYYDFECKCELCNYEKKKYTENKNKEILDEYLIQLDNDFQNEVDKKDEYMLNKKSIENMVKFMDKNKKDFSCYEKSMLFLKCADCMKKYDTYIAYDYLEKALKYSEGRNYYFEKLTLIMMFYMGKSLRSEARTCESVKKLRKFFGIYFEGQKEFVDIILNEILAEKN